LPETLPAIAPFRSHCSPRQSRAFDAAQSDAPAAQLGLSSEAAPQFGDDSRQSIAVLLRESVGIERLVVGDSCGSRLLTSAMLLQFRFGAEPLIREACSLGRLGNSASAAVPGV